MKSVVIFFVSFIVADASHNVQRALQSGHALALAQNFMEEEQPAVQIICPNWPPQFYMPNRIATNTVLDINCLQSQQAFSRANPEVLQQNWLALADRNRRVMECLFKGQVVARTLATAVGKFHHDETEAESFCLYVQKYFMTNEQIIDA
jgi:hypothetical protein